MGCDYCGKEMQSSFCHKGQPVWWCQFCSEFFVEDGGNLVLLSPGRQAIERLQQFRIRLGV